MPWPQYDFTTDKPDIEACLFMTSPTSRNLTPGLTAHKFV